MDEDVIPQELGVLGKSILSIVNEESCFIYTVALHPMTARQSRTTTLTTVCIFLMRAEKSALDLTDLFPRASLQIKGVGFTE
jgi:hypothetical protein